MGSANGDRGNEHDQLISIAHAHTIHVSIIVERGEPLDYPHYRHTALWLHYSGDSSAIQAHVVGPIGEFIFDCKAVSDPSENRLLAEVVEVGDLVRAAKLSQIVQVLGAVPIQNRDREFNCQTWVELALRSLKEQGYLTDEAYSKGLDGMVDAIFAAEDEEP